MTSPAYVHWDEVEPRRIDRGPLQGERLRLGAPAGARRAGLSRYRLGPGERAMPVHLHADEEEIFYVLDGHGLSWQDGKAYRVARADCIVHRAGAEAHTIVAADDGLEVLAFGEGSDTNITWLPRAQAWWLGAHWLPSDGPNPFQREADAGPLDVPEPEPERPPTIVALADVADDYVARGDVASNFLDLGRAAGSVSTGMSLVRTDPGRLSCPLHCHTEEEELFVILEGDGALLLGDDEHPVRPGHVIARPPGSRVAHTFRAGPGGLVHLAWGTRRPSDIVYYPRSKKISFRGVGVMARVEPRDYWDGEE
jgi:uncharacterized cupin superfamily protein